ncbi:MAG: hypothetical protein ACFFCW_46900 [Candidatus Hodarchaeota archaeon]
MRKKYIHYLIVASVMIVLLIGCRSTTPTTATTTPNLQPAFKSFKDYPDHAFNLREYIQGMTKGGHNILIWRDPSVNLRNYRSVTLVDFDGRFLPVQHVFSYDPFINSFNANLKSSLKLPREKSSNALRIEGAVVECNPGNRAARYWAGLYGAGKAGGAVICEVYEPGKSRPCIRIYTRDTASVAWFGGNSVAMLNNIFYSVADRLSAALNTRLSH